MSFFIILLCRLLSQGVVTFTVILQIFVGNCENFNPENVYGIAHICGKSPHTDFGHKFPTMTNRKLLESDFCVGCASYFATLLTIDLFFCMQNLENLHLMKQVSVKWTGFEVQFKTV